MIAADLPEPLVLEYDALQIEVLDTLVDLFLDQLRFLSLTIANCLADVSKAVKANRIQELTRRDKLVMANGFTSVTSFRPPHDAHLIVIPHRRTALLPNRCIALEGLCLSLRYIYQGVSYLPNLYFPTDDDLLFTLRRCMPSKTHGDFQELNAKLGQ